jgi:hypothetical protein
MIVSLALRRQRSSRLESGRNLGEYSQIDGAFQNRGLLERIEHRNDAVRRGTLRCGGIMCHGFLRDPFKPTHRRIPKVPELAETFERLRPPAGAWPIDRLARQRSFRQVALFVRTSPRMLVSKLKSPTKVRGDGGAERSRQSGERLTE